MSRQIDGVHTRPTALVCDTPLSQIRDRVQRAKIEDWFKMVGVHVRG